MMIRHSLRLVKRQGLYHIKRWNSLRENCLLPLAQRARSVTGCTWWAERLLVRIPAPLRSRLLSLKGWRGIWTFPKSVRWRSRIRRKVRTLLRESLVTQKPQCPMTPALVAWGRVERQGLYHIKRWNSLRENCLLPLAQRARSVTGASDWTSEGTCCHYSCKGLWGQQWSLFVGYEPTYYPSHKVLPCQVALLLECSP
jgi:hypothetical protein